MRVLFVCSGNTCRSPMAVALARSLGAAADSAGIHARAGQPAAAGAEQAMRRRGLSLAAHRTRRLDRADLAAADCVVALDARVAAGILALDPALRRRLVTWDTPDPFGGNDATYEECALRLEQYMARLAARGWRPMRVALGADHAGFALKEAAKEWLRQWGVDYEDFGTDATERTDYPDFAALVAHAVAEGRADAGILVCGSGIGMSIAANKVPGVRAAVCRCTYDARVTRNDNDANVLCLGGRITGEGLAQEIMREFLETPFAGGRHAARVEKIRGLEGQAPQ